jgi:FkbM family methyltransferase
MHQAATMLMRSFGRAGRALPEVRGRGRLAIALTSLLLKVGADPIVQCEMTAGHLLRLDCRVPDHCWAFFSGKYDDEKRSALLSFLRPGGAALDVGANIGFYTIPMAAFAKSIGARVVAIEPVAVNTQWLRYNLALNDCVDVVDVFEVGLSDECGEAEIVLAEDFLAGGTVGNATIASRELYGPQFSRAVVRLETLDRIWAGKARLDAAKVDIEGHETKFLRGGRKTIASHRPVIMIEVNRWHHEQRGVDFDTVIPSLLPDRYAFAQLRSGGIVQIDNIARCTDTDFLAIPEERLHEIDRREWRDRSFGRNNPANACRPFLPLRASARTSPAISVKPSTSSSSR